MITCQGTTQARKSKRACFDIGLGTSPYTPVHAVPASRAKRAIAAVSLSFAASPLAPQPDRLIRIISMAVRDHASLVTHRNTTSSAPQ
jgi:hypothetical protein